MGLAESEIFAAGTFPHGWIELGPVVTEDANLTVSAINGHLLATDGNQGGMPACHGWNPEVEKVYGNYGYIHVDFRPADDDAIPARTLPASGGETWVYNTSAGSWVY